MADDLLDELARFGAGQPLSSCPGLAAAFGDPAQAAVLAESALGRAIIQFRAAPLAYWPWRHFSNDVLHSAVLAARGRASLSLVLIDGAAWTAARYPSAPDWVAFQPGELHAAVLAGAGAARILRNRSDDPARAALESEPLRLWQALRECPALDSAVGFAALVETASREDDPLAPPARALIETLAARDPAFAMAQEDLLCPA